MSTKGKRYSQEEKQEVVDYVHSYNAEHNGRGGVANAAKHFNITAMTIKTWVDKDTRPVIAPLAVSKGGNIFQQLGELHTAIAEKEAELTSLKAQFETLKAKVDL